MKNWRGKNIKSTDTFGEGEGLLATSFFPFLGKKNYGTHPNEVFFAAGEKINIMQIIQPWIKNISMLINSILFYST